MKCRSKGNFFCVFFCEKISKAGKGEKKVVYSSDNRYNKYYR